MEAVENLEEVRQGNNRKKVSYASQVSQASRGNSTAEISNLFQFREKPEDIFRDYDVPTDVRLLIDAVTGTVRDGESQHVPTFRRLTPRQLVWLRAYGGSGRLGIACRAAGVSWKAHGSWLKHNPDFRDAFELVRLELVRRLENVALARVFSPEKCSDRLLIFMLKRLDKMAERSAKSGEQER